MGNKQYDKTLDNTYHTLAVKGTRLFLPLVNYAFGENFPRGTSITALANDASKPNAKAGDRMIYTDATFHVGGKQNFFFILEEQTWKDTRIFQRLYEYMLAQTNMHLGDMVESGEITLPQVGVINIRDTQEPRKVTLRYGRKQKIDVTCSVINMQDFKGIDELVKHGLYCLMPYHMFIMDAKVRKQGLSPEEKEALQKRYIKEHWEYEEALLSAENEGILTPEECHLIEEMRKRSLSAARWEKHGFNVKEMERMGGQLLELQYEKDFANARKEGEANILNELLQAGLLHPDTLKAYAKKTGKILKGVKMPPKLPEDGKGGK